VNHFNNSRATGFVGLGRSSEIVNFLKIFEQNSPPSLEAMGRSDACRRDW